MNLVTLRSLLAVFCVAAWAVGCGKDARTDGGKTSGDPDAGASGPGGEPSAAAVAACEASVDAVHAACNAEEPGAPRLCLYDGYRPFCRTGRTEVVKAIFDCLKEDACQTPSDPSAAADCVDGVVRSFATAGDRAFAAAMCACDSARCTEPDTDAVPPDIMLLSSADEDAFTSCMAEGCDLEACVNASPLATANACPGL